MSWLVEWLLTEQQTPRLYSFMNHFLKTHYANERCIMLKCQQQYHVWTVHSNIGLPSYCAFRRLYSTKNSDSKKKIKTSRKPKFGTIVTFFQRVQNELLQDCPLDFATKSMCTTLELAKANKIAFLALQANKFCITNYRATTLTHGAKKLFVASVSHDIIYCRPTR